MRIVSICSLKGGVGKTSVALGLAGAAMAEGRSVLVVDLDPQGDATTALGVMPEGDDPTVADVIARPSIASLRSVITPSAWTPRPVMNGNHSVGSVVQGARPVLRPGRVPTIHATGLPDPVVDVLPGGEATATFERHDANKAMLTSMHRALSKLPDTAYDLVLIDCPPSLGSLTQCGIAASHRGIVVTEPSLFALNGAGRALRSINDVREQLNPTVQPLGIVVNRVRAGASEHAYRLEELKDLYGPLVLTPYLSERTAVGQAQGSGIPLAGLSTAGAREMRADFHDLLARILHFKLPRA